MREHSLLGLIEENVISSCACFEDIDLIMDSLENEEARESK